MFEESKNSSGENKLDTSQRGDGSCFRNTVFNGKRIWMRSGMNMVLRTKGILEFDFVSTLRPGLGDVGSIFSGSKAGVLSHIEFGNYMKEHFNDITMRLRLICGQSDSISLEDFSTCTRVFSFSKKTLKAPTKAHWSRGKTYQACINFITDRLHECRQLCDANYLTPSQFMDILEAFPLEFGGAREEVAVCAFSRLTNLEDFYGCISKYIPEAGGRLASVVARLGWLNILHPVHLSR